MEKTKTTKFLGSFSFSKNGGGGGTGTTDYNDLTNKPKVNGVTLSGNKTSADLGITTLTPFPSTWPTTGKFEDLLAAIRADATAVKGASFLGEVTFDDLPANLGNAEVKVEILEGTTSATKVIHSVITSGNRKPYRWEYTSWNSGNSNSGWISFQLPLTAGTGISIENNVISATGGTEKYGIKGDYASKYGIISVQNGLITYASDSKEVTVKAGIQLLMPGSDTKTQIGSDIKYTINSTSDVTLFLADGEVKEAEGVYFQTEEPENGQEAYLAWFSPEVGKWQFKSNDDGNVWRTPTKAGPLADVHLSETGVIRVDYVGYRVLNDQIFALKSELNSKQDVLTAGNNITIVDNVISATGGSSTTISPVLNNQSTDATASSSKAVWDKVKVLEDNPVSGNDDFLITGTGVLATVSSGAEGGREFTKTKDAIAYGMVYANTSGYDGPILVSEDKDVVIYTPGGQLGGSFELGGKTWYYSAAEFFVSHGASFTLGLIKVNISSERTFDTLEAAKYVIENGYSYIESGLITRVGNLESVAKESYTKTNLVAGKNISIDAEMSPGGIDANTVACWHFDDDFKDVVAEKVIPNGELSLVSKFGSHSYSFTGVSSTNEVISLQLWKDWTIDFFVRLGSDSSAFVWDGIFSGYSAQTLLAVHTNKVYLATASGAGKDVSLTNPISSSEWHHVSYVHDSSSSTVKVYIDGSVIASESVTYPEVAFSACNFNGYTQWNIDELRISDIVRPLNSDGKFPVPTKAYAVEGPTGKNAINCNITGADIQITYVANPEASGTTTSDINTALTLVCEDIHNVLTNVPTGPELMSTTVYPYQAPLATDATLADVIAKVNTILAIMSERGIMKKNS